MLEIYVDADGCPVKDEVLRVAGRYRMKVYLVANTPFRAAPGGLVESVVVRGGFNEADDWIAEKIAEGDIAITADIPLADRCLAKGARVLGPTGRAFTERSIGGQLASRDLMRDLRQEGTITGGPPPFRPADRSRFLSSLDNMVQAVRRKHPPAEGTP